MNVFMYVCTYIRVFSIVVVSNCVRTYVRGMSVITYLRMYIFQVMII